MPLGCCGLRGSTDTAINTMFKKALIAAVSVALSAPAYAGSLGTITGTSATSITSGNRNYSLTGTYTSEEHVAESTATGFGSAGTTRWKRGYGRPSISATTVGNNSGPISASATYSTNELKAGAFKETVSSSFTGAEASTSTGIFFNY